jgi:predicted helicase
MAEQADDLRAQLAHDPNADSIAQAAVCAAPTLASAVNGQAVLDCLLPQLAAWEGSALDRAEVLSAQYSALSKSSPLHDPRHLYDTFLHHYSHSNRKHRGVFFTPEPIADYIVAQVDRLLRDECGFANGLADERVTIIDPACGTGVFLLAVINFLHRKSNDNRWLESLLCRLIGIEILPPAALLSKLNLALKLGEFDFDFRPSDKIQIVTADALSPALNSSFRIHHSAFPVLLGNPPFSSLSTNTNPWIARLVRGDDEIRGYVRANGQQLGERKTWLHDDYVKFIRLAQWHVEQADGGLVGFVTNHGYLDNATFRLMRHELLRVFPHIEILDLHGNRRTRGAGFQPAKNDENVFQLDQGIAISLLCRPTTTRSASEESKRPTTKYAELRGSRETKLATLSVLSPASFTPTAPDWQFSPIAKSPQHTEYTSSWSLADAMPVNTTAPVTARDHFVVAFSREELNARVQEFRNLQISDDEIRERYFHRTRSARYQTGDTRSWKLSAARRIVAADDQWQEKIIRCLYRPFDWRYVFWSPAMIDWPRHEVTGHLITKNHESRTRGIQNLCLIARRQQLPAQPCTFFWISDCLAMDGVIRSDNRGSESLFPLFFDRRANFALPFIEQFATVVKLTWSPLGRGDLSNTFGPEDLLAYIYALFHSPSYREKHADELRRDFPRILMPSTTIQFAQMARFGYELIDLHVLRNPIPHSELHAPHSASSFRAGGYLALKKWLQPKHRSEGDLDYQRITAAIARTIEIIDQIDAAAT